MTYPALGEQVLLVPQAHGDLMNPHVDNAFGKEPGAIDVTKPNGPRWETFTSTLLRKGFGVLVVRDGLLVEGPSDWDSGD